MKKDINKIANVFVLLMVVLFVPTTGFAGDINVEFGHAGSVKVTKARITSQSESQLKLVGQLYRPHRLPMAGHLHAYTYLKNGDLASDSKHRVPGLTSQRKGSMRLPFNVSIKGVFDKVDRIFLEYHSPGHSEG